MNICGKCGRFFYENYDHEDAWLIADDVRYAPEHGVRVVRCPQHVTVWALRCAGLGRSARLLRHYFVRRIEDDERTIAVNPYITPIPIKRQGAQGAETSSEEDDHTEDKHGEKASK